jgi:hypothetical protein
MAYQGPSSAGGLSFWLGYFLASSSRFWVVGGGSVEFCLLFVGDLEWFQLWIFWFMDLMLGGVRLVTTYVWGLLAHGVEYLARRVCWTCTCTALHGGQRGRGHVKSGRTPIDVPRLRTRRWAPPKNLLLHASEFGVRVRRPPGCRWPLCMAALFGSTDADGVWPTLCGYGYRSMGTVVGPYPVAVASGVLPGWRHMLVLRPEAERLRHRNREEENGWLRELEAQADSAHYLPRTITWP